MPGRISGVLSASERPLTGKMSVRPTALPYTGDYEVTPKTQAQVLQTAGKTMVKNLVVNAVPYHETSNQSNGLTVHIAEEV